MAKICKNCGNKVSMFAEPEVNEEGYIICKECSDKTKAERERLQKQKEEDESKLRLFNVLSTNPQWEYKVISYTNEEELNKLGLEGWEMVSASAKSLERKEGDAEKHAEILCIFKRKL